MFVDFCSAVLFLNDILNNEIIFLVRSNARTVERLVGRGRSSLRHRLGDGRNQQRL